MKKFLLLISVLIMSSVCCLGCEEVSTESRYELRGDYETNKFAGIILRVDYQLPEHRTKDFLETILIIMSKPELYNKAGISIGFKEDNGTRLYSSPSSPTQATVDNNSNYSIDATDLKNSNYYTHVISYDNIISEGKEVVQLYLRQTLEQPTTISFMTMKKSRDATNYTYVGNTLVNEMTTIHAESQQPLPDILK